MDASSNPPTTSARNEPAPAPLHRAPQYTNGPLVSKQGIAIILSATLLILSFAAGLVACFTTRWVSFHSASVKTNAWYTAEWDIGLWRHCVYGAWLPVNQTRPCRSLDLSSLFNAAGCKAQIPYGWQATRILVVVATTIDYMAFLILFCFVFARRRYATASVLSCSTALAFVCWVIAVSVFVSSLSLKYCDNLAFRDLMSKVASDATFSYSWSFWVAVAAGATSLAALLSLFLVFRLMAQLPPTATYLKPPPTPPTPIQPNAEGTQPGAETFEKPALTTKSRDASVSVTVPVQDFLSANSARRPAAKHSSAANRSDEMTDDLSTLYPLFDYAPEYPFVVEYPLSGLGNAVFIRPIIQASHEDLGFGPGNRPPLVAQWEDLDTISHVSR
eukprot:TRINITY_DN21896_c0_g1_i1.p1 TRINITY_DN21896_c0_g1~~TRINITY_DN21896_c0_g1_i1.p1  ORF type:complete len:404 (-),score=38.25 TRINITY_DN21896_c0_g1_i1:611-1774(-)